LRTASPATAAAEDVEDVEAAEHVVTAGDVVICEEIGGGVGVEGVVDVVGAENVVTGEDNNGDRLPRKVLNRTGPDRRRRGELPLAYAVLMRAVIITGAILLAGYGYADFVVDGSFASSNRSVAAPGSIPGARLLIDTRWKAIIRGGCKS
jgi:hypothetical protein